MEKETATGIRVATEWALGVGAVIAIVAGMGVLIKPAVVLLVAVGVLGLTAAAFEHGWISFKNKLKSLAVVLVIVGFMGFIGWKAWPHEFEKVDIEWTPPSAIDTETPLSLKQLNAKTSVDGDFVYAPSMGTRLPVGIDPLTVTFSPRDSEKYHSTSKTIKIKVVPAPTVPIPPQKPTDADLIAEFVSSSDLELVISNVSEVTAKQPTFQTYLVNLDESPIRILPIGRQTGDFLQGHASLLRIPILHYGNSLAIDGMKTGDRVFGWISLSCSNCLTVRYYYVFYDYQKDGWYAISSEEPKFDMRNFEAIAKAPALLDDLVKPNHRIVVEDKRGVVHFHEQGTLR
jgi:hypothetical protein